MTILPILNFPYHPGNVICIAKWSLFENFQQTDFFFPKHAVYISTSATPL